MGYDVHLSWDGMTNEEKDAQRTGWALNAGHVGYLRAAIWMHREIKFLGHLFPHEYWMEDWKKPGEPPPYDFKGNFPRMEKIAKDYLNAAGAKESLEHLLALPMRETRTTNDEDGEEVVFVDYPTDYLRGTDAEDWIRSLLDFFKLGLKKQEEGRNPRVAVA